MLTCFTRITKRWIHQDYVKTFEAQVYEGKALRRVVGKQLAAGAAAIAGVLGILAQRVQHTRFCVVPEVALRKQRAGSGAQFFNLAAQVFFDLEQRTSLARQLHPLEDET